LSRCASLQQPPHWKTISQNLIYVF
jgi:hypothetical protein